jgi:HK97 family phage major capsid protein
MERLKQIAERMAAIQAELGELETLARADDFEAYSDEDEARIDDLSREFDDLEAEAVPLRERQEKLARIKATAVKMVHGDDRSDPLGQPGSLEGMRTDDGLWDLDALASTRNVTELRSKALHAIERSQGMNEAVKKQATRFVESIDEDDDSSKVLRHMVAVSSPDYMRAFSRYLKAGLRGQSSPEAETYLQRAMSLTDAAGGYAVPLPVDPTLNITGDGSANPFRQIGNVVPITTDKLRTVNAAATSFSWDGEAAEVSDDSSTFANVDITAHKAQGFIPYSIEIGQDYPGFTTQIGRLLAEGRDNLEASAFATGAGDASNQPVGIVTALTGGSYVIDSATTDTFAVADVYALDDGLGAKWRPMASFVAAKPIYNLVRQFDTTGGTDLWVRLGAGLPPELIGYPAFEASAMDSTVTASGENYLMVLGDFSNYVIANRIGFSVEAIPHLFATPNNRPSGQRGLYAYWRVGADSVNDSAFRMLNVT